MKLLLLAPIVTTLLLSSCLTNGYNNSQNKDASIPTDNHSGIENKSTALTYIDELLLSGEELRVWIVAPLDKINYRPLPDEPPPGPEWKERQADQAVGNLTRGFLERTGQHPNASILDRDYIDYVLVEQNLQLSGITKTTDIMRIGDLVGANYLLVISLETIHISPTHYVETEVRELLQMSNGTVRANDTFRVEVDLIGDQWVPTSFNLNGKPFVFGTDGARYLK